MRRKTKVNPVEPFKADPNCPCRLISRGWVRSETGVRRCPCYLAYKERQQPVIAPEQVYKNRQAGVDA